MHVSVGPDETCHLLSFKKSEKTLHIKSVLHIKKLKYFIDYNIDCLDNTFKVTFSAPEESASDISVASSSYFYFYLQSDCRKCNCSYCNGSDLELDLENQKIVNVGIEREGVYLLDPSDKYHVTLEYDKNITTISKCYKHNEEIIDLPPTFHCPIIKLDMKDSVRAIKKIKTLIVFS